jgi:hypothetical protein
MFDLTDQGLVVAATGADNGFEVFDQEWWFPELEGDGGWTEFPMLRGAVSPGLAELSDEELAEDLWNEGFDAEELESFMQVLGDIGSALANALPGIGAGAATGASVGSVVPGIGTGIGAAVGGVLGGLSSIVNQFGKGGHQPAAARPAPPARSTTAARPTAPTQVRPGVSRAPVPASTASGTPAASSQTLIRLLTNPQVIQALTALTLGPNGRESIEVAGREIPTPAFAEMLSELARESMYAPGAGMEPERYLSDETGEALVDLESPPDRAGALIGLLAAEAMGEELPFGEPLLPSPWAEFDEPVETDVDYGESSSYDEVLEDRYEDDVVEGGPALIAVAGVIISGANLGLGVFDRLEKHVLSGSFEVNSHAASYIHSPSPRGLTVQTRTFTFPVSAHHPRYGIGTQTFWFRLTLEYDGFNIRRASIVEDRGRSSTLVSSDFKITFTPAAWSASNEPVAAVVYNINGRWDPVGSGDEGFDGRIIIDAQGNLRSLRVSSPQRWVWHGRVSQGGGGPVPRPTRAHHAHAVSFDRPGSTKPSEAAIRGLHAFYSGLPSAVRDEIAAGRISVKVTGRASTTASAERNQTIGRQRAAAVASTLKDLAGSAARIEIAAHGELGARTGDNREDPAERRADVRIEYDLYR